MSRWSQPFGKMEQDATAREKMASDSQRRLQKALDDGEITEDELAEIMAGDWVNWPGPTEPTE